MLLVNLGLFALLQMIGVFFPISFYFAKVADQCPKTHFENLQHSKNSSTKKSLRLAIDGQNPEQEFVDLRVRESKKSFNGVPSSTYSKFRNLIKV
jgi:hypothetical protein